MRTLWQVAGLLLCAGLLAACGAGHPKLSSISVTPTSATALAASPGTVEFTAKGTFDNNSSRTLTQADGLTWNTSNHAIATIDDSGTTTCAAVGVVTVAATAPVDLNITISNGIQNTSTKISGSAQLTCM
jgi:hypothetical protein